MQDVFEPTANFGGDVFEPMNFDGEVFEPMNFGGDVFEPMNFDGDYSNFYKVDPNAIVQGGTAIAGLVGQLAGSRSTKQLSKTDEQKQIDTICGSRQKFLLKKKKNTYNDCKNKVLADLKASKQQNIDLSNKQLDLSKISLLTSSKDKKDVENELKAKNKRNLMIGLSVGVGVLALGTILFFVLRKK
jgi:hypothetical protein